MLVKQYNKMDSINKELLSVYALYISILAIKMLLMTWITGIMRFIKGAFANPEDAKFTKKGVVVVDQTVERTRRAHLNDLENIPVFMIVSFAYILTGPSVFLATMLFRIFTAARIMHTLVYAVVVVPQPARLLAFAVGFLTTCYMMAMLIIPNIAAF